MTFEKFILNLKSLVSQGNLKGAIDILRNSLKPKYVDNQNRIIIIESRLVLLNKKSHSGVISTSAEKLEHNKLTAALLSFIDSVKEDEVELLDIAIFSELYTILKGLGLSPLPRYALVDCNRREAIEAYQRAFKFNRKLPYQFYFVIGCPTQKPNSFAERVIYELIEEYFFREESALHYIVEPFHLDEKGQNVINRAAIEPLPFSNYLDLEGNQARFRKYFDQRLQKIKVAKYPSLESMILNPKKRLPFHIFSLIFSIDVDELSWTPELTQYLLWLINLFKANQSLQPSFKFIFVVSMENAHKIKRHEVEEGIEILFKAHNQEGSKPCIRIDQFQPLTVDDLKRWFNKRTKGLYPEEVESWANNFAQKHRLDMAIVERQLLDIFKFSHKIH